MPPIIIGTASVEVNARIAGLGSMAPGSLPFPLVTVQKIRNALL